LFGLRILDCAERIVKITPLFSANLYLQSCYFFFGAGEAGNRPCARKIMSRVSGGNLLISSSVNGRVIRCHRSGGRGFCSTFACFPPSFELDGAIGGATGLDGTSGGATEAPGAGAAGVGATTGALAFGAADGRVWAALASGCGAACLLLQPTKPDKNTINIRTLFMLVNLLN
jgi:hypothetical protein